MITSSQIMEQKDYLTRAIFKVLPYKEEGYEDLDKYFEFLIQRLNSFNCIIDSQPVVITVISLIKYAQTENDFKKFRKAILDACGLIQGIKEGDVNV